MSRPALVVLSSLFPSAAQPGAGIFVRERMFRVGKRLPLTVVSPQPWFPGQGIIRKWHPHYRLIGVPFEVQGGFEIYRPRALALPGVGRRFDGFSMALAALPRIRRLQEQNRCDILDAHFAYPDGYAASLVAQWLKLPYCTTLRGTEKKHLAQPSLRKRVVSTLRGAARVFTVSESLRRIALAEGVPLQNVEVVGNGVDTSVFYPVDKASARAAVGVEQDAKVMITVGGLVERKGFHRVLVQMPGLLAKFPKLVYLIVGGPTPEGDWSARLRQLVDELGLSSHVRFLGAMAPEALRVPLSAADVSVLASSNEGWANVLLEAMACGVPVVASDVGGNAEVVCREDLGLVFKFGDDPALYHALDRALSMTWRCESIIRYAAQNAWDGRVEQLLAAFDAIAAGSDSEHLAGDLVD